MAKSEIHMRFGLIRTLWWKYMSGPTITIKWPTGWTEPDHLGNSVLSSDPNDHYREILEANVGKQKWDWDWKVGSVDVNTLDIKFRNKHKEFALLFQLTYGG
jgi:hypothetical protein